ncbi:hypothetical protein Micbo1qcDRAFT_160069, partial [Microdochium bolleyi]
MIAASTERFVQGLCHGVVNPESLPGRDPDTILLMCHTWNQMDSAVWAELLTQTDNGHTETLRPVATRPDTIRTDVVRTGANHSDPEHLQTGLQRMQSVRTDDPSSHKPHHLGDRAAMEAVMARRSDRPSTQVPKYKPLPTWADEAVKNGQSRPSRQSSLIAPPPSSAPPQTVSTNSTSPVP